MVFDRFLAGPVFDGFFPPWTTPWTLSGVQKMPMTKMLKKKIIKKIRQGMGRMCALPSPNQLWGSMECPPKNDVFVTCLKTDVQV